MLLYRLIKKYSFEPSSDLMQQSR